MINPTRSIWNLKRGILGRIKERIENREKTTSKSFNYEKSSGNKFDNIIDAKNNKKVKSSKGYETALNAIKKTNYSTLDINTLSDKYMDLKEEKNELMDKYSYQNSIICDLQNLKKNTDNYIENEREKKFLCYLKN